MGSNKAIGGYFGLEIPDRGTVYHDGAMAINLGRSGLDIIIKSGSYQEIWVPYYTCDVVIDTLRRAGVNYRFYQLNEDMLPEIDELKEQTAVLYINYFGVHRTEVEEVSRIYGNVILDNCQAFYEPPLPNIPTFYSPRKFFGVPDGGFVYPNMTEAERLPDDKSYERCAHLLKRVDVSPEYGFEDYKQNDANIEEVGIKKMSNLSYAILRGVDYLAAKELRNQNFVALDKELSGVNEFRLKKGEINAPLCYPLLHERGSELKKFLITNRVFVPTYWPGVDAIVDPGSIEHRLNHQLICLPIDQRYGEEEMDWIIQLIKKFGIL